MADLTGRDDYILNEALALAIAVIPRLPPEYQQHSDREDMLTILRSRGRAQYFLDMAAETVAHLPEAPTDD
jgi:hypothetical protein